MSEHPKYLYTLEEYFALERETDTRYEYWEGEIFCMSGAKVSHNRIAGNLYYMLRAQLEGRSCETFGPEQRVKVPAAPPYRYPDVSVACSEPEFEDVAGLEAVVNPVLLVEVLSETTEKYDKGAKFTAYKSIPSFREYVLVAQDRVHLTRYLKQDDETWTDEEVTDLDGSIYLHTVDCTLALRDGYERVKFEM